VDLVSAVEKRFKAAGKASQATDRLSDSSASDVRRGEHKDPGERLIDKIKRRHAGASRVKRWKGMTGG
jgi:hypothetical protein